MSYEEKVYTKLKQHYHCAQAIFATYASDYGMDQETAYRTMACFAAGMYRGSVCGCVTAALAVLGLAYGFSDTKDREREIFGTKIAEEFVDRFQERMEGKFNCADILENNINTAEGMASIRREGMIKKKCTQAIQTSIEILEDMLRAYPDMLAGKPAEPSCDEQEIEKITYLVKRAQKIQHFESNVRDLILHSSKSIACIQFDISRFKIINDIYGERMGDQILQFIKDNLAEICNETQYYLNLRSDVFVVLSEFQQESELDELVRQIQTRCNMFKNIKLTYSIGVYIVNDRKMDLRQIEDRAAMARKKAKGNMMNNVLYYQEEFKEMLYIRNFIEESLPSAIDEKQFQMYLQPKYSIVQNHIVGAEALVRWQHPDRGMIYPNEFIPVIEENGYIKKVDYYIWKEACNFLKRCEQAGIKNCPVSVNVSRLHLTDTVFMDYLAQTIHEAGIPKEQLELEITETIGDEQISNMAELLKHQGYKLLMDDFGSGYSSLNILLETPFDVIKLDKKFMENMMVSEKGRLILEYVVAMADKLGLELLAEGVETEEQVKLLRKIGCDNVQGYYYAKPMPRFKSRGYGYWLSIVLSAIWLALYTGSDRLQLFDVMDSI